MKWVDLSPRKPGLLFESHEYYTCNSHTVTTAQRILVSLMLLQLIPQDSSFFINHIYCLRTHF